MNKTESTKCLKKSSCVLSHAGSCFGPATRRVCIERNIPGKRLALLLNIYKTIHRTQSEVEEVIGAESVFISKKIIFHELTKLRNRGYFDESTISDFEILFNRWKLSEKGEKAEVRDSVNFRKGRGDAMNILLFLLDNDMRQGNDGDPHIEEIVKFLEEHKILTESDENAVVQNLRKRASRQVDNRKKIETIYLGYWKFSYVGAISGTMHEGDLQWHELARFELPTWESISSAKSEPIYECCMEHPIEDYQWFI